MDAHTGNVISHLPREVTRLVIRGNLPLLKAWRIYLGMTLSEAAEKSGLDASIIQEMEKMENPFSEELDQLARALNVQINLLVDLDPIKGEIDIYC